MGPSPLVSIIQLVVISMVILIAVHAAQSAPLDDIAMVSSGEMHPYAGYAPNPLLIKKRSPVPDPSSDPLLDYIINRQAYHNLAYAGGNPQAKRNTFRLCSVNAVACFGRKK